MTATDRPLRRFALAAAVAGTLVLAACDGEPSSGGTDAPGAVTRGGEPADPTSPVDRPDADFRAHVTVTDAKVRVTYRFTNSSDAEMLLPDRLADENAEYDGDTGRAYVTGDGADRIAISQRVFPQPDTDRMDWAQAPKVQATRLAPGETVEVELRVPRPLERVQPFGDDLGYGVIALPEATEVEFCLGVLTAPYAVAVSDQAGTATPMLDHSNQTAQAQHLLCSDPVAL